MFRCPAAVFPGKPPDQEQQPEQEQKGAAKLPKISVFVGDSEGTLDTLWALFSAFPVLHCPCASLSGSRFSRIRSRSRSRSKKELQSCEKYEFLGAFLGLPRPSLPLCFAVRQPFSREAAGSGVVVVVVVVVVVAVVVVVVVVVVGYNGKLAFLVFGFGVGGRGGSH